MVMSPALSNETTTANQLVNDASTLQSSEFSPGGSMAPTVINNYNGSTSGQGQLLNQANTNSSGGALGLSPQQIGQIAGKGINALSNPSSSFNTLLNNVDNFGTNFGFGAPSTGAATSGGDLVAAGIDNVGGNTSLLTGANSSALSNEFGAALMGDTNAGAAGSAAFGSSSLAGGTGATDALGNAGADSLGITADAGGFTSASLSSVLGAAGLGALGGSLIANLTGGNPVGSSIGGGLGAAAGEAFGGAAASALGLELGSFAGPVGAIVGGIGGSLIGGMIGNKSPPTNADSFQANLAADGSVTNQDFTSKNAGPVAGFAAKQQQAFSSLAQNASQALGINFSNILVGGGISTKHPGPGGDARIAVDTVDANGNTTVVGGTENNFYNPQDAASTQNAMINALKAAAVASGYTNTDALNNYIKQVTTSGSSTGLPQGTPNVTPNAGSFAATVAQQKQGQTQNASSTATPAI